MAAKQKYMIIAGVGDRPETKKIGTPEKNQDKNRGVSRVDGEMAEILNTRATIGVPNFVRAWGVRLNKKGDIPEEQLGVKDLEYKGQIKELKWNDPKGCLIECRYLKGYNSIDMQYQDLVLNASSKISTDTEAAAEASMLYLQSGDNFYDPETDKYLVQMLRISNWNESSIYVDPNGNTTFLLREKDVEAESQRSETSLDAKSDALLIVKEASNDNTGEKLKNLLYIIGEISDNTPKETERFRYLQNMADIKPEAMLREIALWKQKVNNAIEKGKSYKIIDDAQDNVIAVTDGKEKKLFDNIPAKKFKTLDWVQDNYLSEVGFTTAFQIIEISEKLK